MMEPTDNQIHAGCLGNINATWTFHGRSGHSARPWNADNAMTRAARGITRLDAIDPIRHDFGGLEFRRGRVGDPDQRRHRRQRDPGAVDCRRELPLRPGSLRAGRRRTAARRGAARTGSRCRSSPTPLRPGGRHRSNPLVARLVALGDLDVAAQAGLDAGRRVRSARLDAVNFGPGDPHYAHRRDEQSRSRRCCAVPHARGLLCADDVTAAEPDSRRAAVYPFVAADRRKQRPMTAASTSSTSAPASRAKRRPRSSREALATVPAHRSRPTRWRSACPITAKPPAGSARRFGARLDPATELIPTLGTKELIFYLAHLVGGGSRLSWSPTPGYPVAVRGAAFDRRQVVDCR